MKCIILYRWDWLAISKNIRRVGKKRITYLKCKVKGRTSTKFSYFSSVDNLPKKVSFIVTHNS